MWHHEQPDKLANYTFGTSKPLLSRCGRCCKRQYAALSPLESASLLESKVPVMLGMKSPTSPTSPMSPAATTVKPSPADHASFLSRLLFLWMNQIMRLGFARPLEAADLPDVNEDDKAAPVSDRFFKEWNAAMARCKPGEEPSVGKVLMKAYGGTFAAGAILKLMFDTVQFIGPMLLSSIIQFLEDTNNGLEPPLSLGLSYVALLFCSSLVQTLLLHQYFLRSFKVGQNVRAGLIVAVYNKALRLSLLAKQKLNTGTITNLMSTDAKRLQDLLTYVTTVFSGPWQIALSLIFLWQQIGISVLAGLGVMLLFLPLNGIIARQSQRLQNRLMQIKDKRISLTSEVLQGFRLIKYNGWERHFLDSITSTRNMELLRLRTYQLLMQMSDMVWQGLPLLVTLASFGCYTLLNGKPPSATNLFTSLSLFNMLRFPLSMFPNVISSIVEAQVSLRRLRKHLTADEIAPDAVLRLNGGNREVDNVSLDFESPSSYNSLGYSVGAETPVSTAIQISNGNFCWDPTTDNQFRLEGVDLSVHRGDFVAVVGPVGAGKTTLLHALLGELHKSSGSVILRGRVAYASQSPFILNATLRENVLFGRPYDARRYDTVLDVCQLRADLQILPAGDKTEIGEKGINLSGGQQARVALARAVYADADVYLLDDVLSAVDAHVGAKIFSECIQGALAGKTRVLVTHGLQYVRTADNILVMKTGRVIENGTFAQLVTEGHGPVLMSLMASFESDTSDLIESMESAHAAESSESTRPAKRGLVHPESTSNLTDAPAKQITKEVQAKGRLKRSVYIQYMQAVGGWKVVLLVMIMFIAFQGTSMGASAWLSSWSSNTSDDAGDNMRSLGIYALISFVSLIVLVALRVFIAFIGVRAARTLHQDMLQKIMFVPLSFIDTTPVGRIINRCSQDVYVVDEQLPDTYSSFMSTFMSVLGTVVLISVITPWFLVALVPLGAFYVYTQQYYVASSRELQRLDSISRSPIFANFGESLAGCVTIRAFQDQRRFIKKNMDLLQANQAAYFVYTTSNRWLAVRLETVSTCITGGAALLAVLARHSGGDFPSLAGLSISTALGLTQTLNWLVRMASDSESQSVSVERIKEYADLPREREPVSPVIPGVEWPSRGAIRMENVRLQYRPETPAVLQDISCSIQPAEHVGIVGRTGAGKSSLIAALFLTADVVDGVIEIDGVNIKRLPLHILRSKVTLIPQNPILFSGTVRRNLDMLDEYSDVAIWGALELVQLKQYVAALKDGLESTVAEGGSNFSAGQRQLLTVARALLKRSKVVILDEASSSVDVQSDAILQQAIRKEFAESTVLTIAHRINTIVDSSRIMVLDAGRIIEFETPQSALSNPDSPFALLVKDSVQAHG